MPLSGATAYEHERFPLLNLNEVQGDVPAALQPKGWGFSQKPKTTITIRLNDQQHALLQRVCRLKNQSRAGYLAHLATEQAKKRPLHYAVKQYVAGKASLSELVTKTVLDISTLMDATAPWKIPSWEG